MEKQFHVKDGDTLICTLGSCDSALCVPVSHGNVIGEKNGATIKDCKSGVNIQSFGLCSGTSPSVPCQPVILNQWIMGDKSVEINGEAALLSTSIVSCARGGIIKVKQQ